MEAELKAEVAAAAAEIGCCSLEEDADLLKEPQLEAAVSGVDNSEPDWIGPKFGYLLVDGYCFFEDHVAKEAELSAWAGPRFGYLELWAYNYFLEAD